MRSARPGMEQDGRPPKSGWKDDETGVWVSERSELCRHSQVRHLQATDAPLSVHTPRLPPLSGLSLATSIWCYANIWLKMGDYEVLVWVRSTDTTSARCYICPSASRSGTEEG